MNTKSWIIRLLDKQEFLAWTEGSTHSILLAGDFQQALKVGKKQGSLEFIVAGKVSDFVWRLDSGVSQ